MFTRTRLYVLATPLLVSLAFAPQLQAEAAKKPNAAPPHAVVKAKAPLSSASPPPTRRTVLDVSRLITKLDQLRQDERADQIADWAVYGTLINAGLSADELRRATYNVAPLRTDGLDEIFDFDYGPGRRVFLTDGSVWLFYSERDEHKTATLARLADQVRMERGAIPPTFTVYRYRSELTQGAIYVEREAKLPGKALFSPGYGYVQKRIFNPEQLWSWLESIDDVTHVKSIPKGGLELGGRRIANLRSKGVEVADVAALYQANTALAKQRAAVQTEVRKASQPLIDAYNGLISEYNRSVRAGLTLYVGGTARTRLLAVKHLLHPGGSESSRHEGAGLELDEGWPVLAPKEARQAHEPGKQYPPRLPDPTADFSYLLMTPAALRAEIAALEPKVKEHVGELEMARMLALQKQGAIPPGEPGFSLDPRWDAAGLQADLRVALRNPSAIIASAQHVLSNRPAKDDSSARPLIVWTARELANNVSGLQPAELIVGSNERAAIDRIIGSVKRVGATGFEDDGVVPFLELIEDLKSEDSRSAARLYALLKYIESRNRMQCARYDGPLQGTRVGMVLFYTDLLAKLWASVDYHKSAPTREVFGFRSQPREGPDLEPLYWDETWKYPATRLWFGPKREAFKGDPAAADGLNFAPVSTRVYSAGSNPLYPGKETISAEASRRVFGWWDRNFARVADFEQAYHVQNQIVKWSVISGWLANARLLRGLDDVAVTRSYRFDRWLADTPDIKFRKPVPFAEEARWVDGRECVEILHSYRFPHAGQPESWVEGGVSLGSAKTLDKSVKIGPGVPIALRRGTLDYEASSPKVLKNVRRTSFEFPAKQGSQAVVKVTPAQDVRIRRGSTEAHITSLRTEYQIQPRRGDVILRSEHGEVGRLRAERSASGLMMDWAEGPVQSDRRRLSLVDADPFAESMSAPEVATREGFLPLDNAYIIEASGRVEVIARPLGAGGTPPPRPPKASASASPSDDGPSRLLVWSDDKPENYAGMPKPYLRSASSPLWPLDALVTGEASNAQQKAAIAVAPAQAEKRLNESVWQRLRPISGEGAGRPGQVERVFTNQGPSDEAFPVRLRTNDPRLTEVEAAVEIAEVAKDTVYLKRPAGDATQVVFNDIVVAEGIDSGYLRNAVNQAQNSLSAEPLSLPPARTPGEVAGYRAAQLAARGDHSGAAQLLRGAAKEGNLDSAANGFLEYLPPDLIADPTLGRHPAVAEAFALLGTTPESQPVIQLAQALRDLRAQRAVTAAEALRRVSAESLGNAAGKFAEAFRKHGSDAANDYLFARRAAASPDSSIHGAGQVTLTAEGFCLHTSLPKSLLPSGKRPALDQLPNLEDIFQSAEHGELYVGDRRLLNKLDWDGEPGPSLAKVLRNPDIKVEVVDDAGTEAIIRPSNFVDKDKRFVRRTPEGPLRGGDADTRSDPSNVASERTWVLRLPIVFVDSCDLNDDGQVTEEERAICHCDLDSDGTVSQTERTACRQG